MRSSVKSGYRRPRTGEQRKVRQPLSIDRLPRKVRDAIIVAREAGTTWVETAKLASEVAGKRLPHTTVHRWYDLRVAQPKKQGLGPEVGDLLQAIHSLSRLLRSIFCIRTRERAKGRRP